MYSYAAAAAIMIKIVMTKKGLYNDDDYEGWEGG
jgi:hypothetical protein